MSSWGGGVPSSTPRGGGCVPTTLPPLTHVLQGAADGVGPLAPPQVPGEAEVGEFEVPCGVRWRVGAPNDGVSPRMGCPHPSATAPYLSHPGGCSPSETNQALGWPICTRGCRDPPPPTILCPPPDPFVTHLHISVHDAQVVEIHWGQDGAIRAGGPLPTPCPLPPPWHPAGGCPPPGGLSPPQYSPSTSTSSAANRRTVASAKRPAARHSACRSPVLQ